MDKELTPEEIEAIRVKTKERLNPRPDYVWFAWHSMGFKTIRPTLNINLTST